jgi:ATP-dependent Lon protease
MSTTDRTGRTGRTVRASRPRLQVLERRIQALYDLLVQVYGPERLVLKAGKLQALGDLRADDPGRKLLGLKKIVLEDPSLAEVPTAHELARELDLLEEELADLLARRTLEEDLEKRIAERMQERHEEYVRDIRLQLIKEESGPETPETQRKLKRLEELETRHLEQSALDIMRPSSLGEVVGQDAAIRALLAKLSSPYPQHLLLYGPPGVGKTTVARLALEAARARPGSVFGDEAPFVEVDGATLRWDPREVTNPLLGSVHDPIYQGARRDLAEGGIPEPKPGLVTEAHGGVLFIDEIGEMDPILQNKLLKVLEDKRVKFDSAYYDPDDPAVPQYVKKMFSEGAPADFVLIGATTRSPDEISPALRSRAAEVFFGPLQPGQVEEIAAEAALRIGVELESEASEMLSRYTLEGRRVVTLLADAVSLALLDQENPGVVTVRHVADAVQSARLPRVALSHKDEPPQIGRVYGLAVAGFQGTVLEVEAACFPAREEGRGQVRFNETAGTMTKDSVFNAATVLRALTGKDPQAYDFHVNVVGGAQVDGPSAGAAIFLALYSAITGTPLRQDVAVTGELSLSGELRAIGGVSEKVFGARQADMKVVVVPEPNRDDVPANPGLEVKPVRTAAELVKALTP